MPFRSGRGADLDAALDQDRRLPGGLRLLSAERAIRDRRQGREADEPRRRAGRGARRQGRGREPLLHGRGLARAEGSRSRAGLRHGRRRARARARNLRHARHADRRRRRSGSRPPASTTTTTTSTPRRNSTARSSPRAPIRTGSTRSSAVRDAGIHVCCGGIVGMGESDDDRAGLIATLASLPQHPESVPINMLVQVEGTPLAGATRSSIRSTSCAPSRSRASPCRNRWCGSPPGART